MSQITISIERATKEDMKKIMDIQKKTMPEPYYKSVWEYLFDNLQESFLVAKAESCCKIGKEVVGYVLGSLGQRGLFERARILSIATDPAYQKKGIAKLMLDAIEKIFKDNRILQYTLEVREDNLAARKFYIKNGFVVIDVLHRFYSNGQNAIEMRKKIQ